MSTLKGQRKLVLLLSLTSILPVLMMGIRWASFSGDTSQAGNLLTKLMFQVVHAVFLGGCLWVGLDPSSSPRNQSIGIPFLSFYYLAALSIGYFSGYFLLLAEAPASRWRRPSAGARLMNQVLAFVVWAALLVMPTLLVFKNL